MKFFKEIAYNGAKKKINEQFGSNMNEDVNGNRKWFWKEVSNAKGELQQNKGWKWEVRVR